MEDQKLCLAGAMLAQRLELGVKNLQDGTVVIRTACKDVSVAMQNIRNTTTDLHARLSMIEQEAEKNEVRVRGLEKEMAGHVGTHAGLEKAGTSAGKKYGMIYGCAGTVISFIVAAAAWYEVLK
jgi:hypothetical protein